MILEGKPPPIPGGGPIVSVVVCCECLGVGQVGWLGPEVALARHLRKKHANEASIDSISCQAQLVRRPFLCFGGL